MAKTKKATQSKLFAPIEKLRQKNDEQQTLTLRLDGNLNKRANLLTERTNAKTVQQAIREAIVLYDILLDEADNGKDIVIVDPKTSAKYSLFEAAT